MKINIGCNKWKLEGFVNVDIREEHDPDVVSDATAYLKTLEPASVSFIYAGHFLEHLTRDEARAFLREARRVLHEDGKIQITVPDATTSIKLFKAGKLDYKTMNGAIFGSLTNEHEAHKQVFDAELLTSLCKEYFGKAKRVKKSPYWVAGVPWQICYEFEK